MPKIFCIYPEDKQQSLKFLNKINVYLSKNLQNDWHCYKIRPNNMDHEKCKNDAIISKARFILFMGHGKSDCLFGSCTKEDSDLISYDAKIEHENKFYKNDDFINIKNINIFNNRIFFSFSCNSNLNSKNSIGRVAIENGVTSFIGFGDIPTDFIVQNNFPLKAISVFKGIITSIVKRSILASIENNYTVQGLTDLIKLETTRKIHELILNNNFRHKDVVIENLYLFKNQIIIFGDRMAKLTD